MNRSSHRSLYLRLKKLGMSKTVLHVGAHPDDEEIGLLSYISYKHYGRAVYWSATRGESGQNRINKYQRDALGVYRTWESLLAREDDGGECLFGPFVDFGFSKNSGEAFSKWGKENVVRELTRAIRLVQPQIIIARWAGTPDDGHGQHQAVGQALLAAVEAAASPASFPELMLQGLPPWRTSKFYRSTNKTIYPTGAVNPSREADGALRINTGEYDPLTGWTYQEQAWMAYGRHQTQGMSVMPTRGEFYYYLALIKSDVPVEGRETDLFQGLETGLRGMLSGIGPVPADISDTLKTIDGLVNEAIEKYRPDRPLPSSLPLCDGLKLLKNLKGTVKKKRLPELEKQAIQFGLERKIKEFEEVVALCLGLKLESLCTRARVTPGESVWVKNRLWNPSGTRIDNVAFKIRIPDKWVVDQNEEALAPGVLPDHMVMNEVFIGNDAALSSPHWLREPKEGALYKWPDGEPCQEPFSSASISAQCTVTMGPHEITVDSPTLHKKAFPGGYRELPLSVIPPISLHPEFDRRICLVSGSEQKFTLQVTARCNDEERPAEGHLTLTGPEGWQICPPSVHITLPPVDGAATCAFDVTIPPHTPEGRYLLQYNICCRNRDYGIVLTPVRMGAPGLPYPDDPATCVKEEWLIMPARVKVFVIDAHLREGQSYGYIEGSREETVSVLQSLGVNVRFIKDADIAHGNLHRYDTIVIGPNAYLRNPQLADNAHRLLEYVEHGGTLIVQYHTYDFEGHGFTPYDFAYNRPHDRVVDENAPVTVLAPDHAFFRFPNPIKTEDFDGWVHDRGLYFFGRWDDRYTPLLSCADAGEPQMQGGLMVCTYGRGIFVYVGYSFFRQLPAGVPGAFRVFFNMLSLKAGTKDV